MVSGMHCESCSNALASAIRVLPGIFSVEAHHDTGKTCFTYDPAKVEFVAIRQQIELAGFEVVGD